MSAQMGSQPKRRVWFRWLIALAMTFALFLFSIGSLVTSARKANALQARKDAVTKEEKAKAQSAYDATSAGKKAKASREKAQLDASVKKTERFLFARLTKKGFRDHGLNVQCEESVGKLTFLVVGEPVNRVFAQQFMKTASLVKGMRSAGFKTVRFWNGHSLTGIYTQEYDLTR
jgi:hypothetical protein